MCKKGYLENDDDIYEVNELIKLGFFQKYPIVLQKALDNSRKYRKDHILEFNLDYIENYLFEEFIYESPWGLIENLIGATELYKNSSYDSAIVKCGKCIEIMINSINEDYDLIDGKNTTGNLINQFKNDSTWDKIKDQIFDDKNGWLTFLDGSSVVYRFRNVMGAHDGPSWGEEQVSMACLLLTYYLTDVYYSIFSNN